MHDAEYWIDQLGLEPHPEGGYFQETYRARLTIPSSALPDQFGDERSASTAIYFLLRGEEFSAFHRIASDEMWHFYAGDTLLVHVIDRAGVHSEIRLGSNPADGEVFQAVVPAGEWFGSCLAQPGAFALVGCTVAPGFDFADFEMADRSSLTAEYPQHRTLIESLTRA